MKIYFVHDDYFVIINMSFSCLSRMSHNLKKNILETQIYKKHLLFEFSIEFQEKIQLLQRGLKCIQLINIVSFDALS